MRLLISIAALGLLALPYAGRAQTAASSAAPAATPAAEPAAGQAAITDSANDLSLTVGKSALVDCAHPTQRVAIGAPDVATVMAIPPNEVMVTGKAPGETSLIIWDRDGGRQFFNIHVRARHASTDTLEGVRRELRNELPDQPVKATMENGSVFLRGTVKDLNTAGRAVQIASTAIGETKGKVVDLLNVETPEAKPQILLKVRFTSVDRSRSKQLGINLFSNGLGNMLGGINTGQYTPPSVTTSGATVTDSLNLFAYFPGLNMGATIKALEAEGVVQVLAEPNIMAVDGREASFLAGGEYPYPIIQGTGGGTAVTIMFKEYGVRLNFLPTITPRGTIHLQVAPEVSSLDFTNAIEVSGFNVPAISTRKMKTDVELADGQSFVIGGLIDNRENETFQKIPFLGDIPILGKFFQSVSRTHTNTELIVLVTPEIVSPIPAGGQTPELKYPRPFMEANTGTPMNTPDAKTAENASPAAKSVLPIEKAIEAVKPPPALIIDSDIGGFGTSGTTNNSTNSTTGVPPALQQQ